VCEWVKEPHFQPQLKPTSSFQGHLLFPEENDSTVVRKRRGGAGGIEEARKEGGRGTAAPGARGALLPERRHDITYSLRPMRHDLTLSRGSHCIFGCNFIVKQKDSY